MTLPVTSAIATDMGKIKEKVTARRSDWFCPFEWFSLQRGNNQKHH